MPEIKGLQHAKEIYSDFAFHHFPKVLELRWFFRGKSNMQCIDMILSSNKEQKKLRVRFEGVSDLQIKDWGSKNVVINGLEIADVSTNHLEGILWQVFDYENGMIKFYCNHVEVILVVPGKNVIPTTKPLE
ncbi:MAG: hypothetical protein HZA50_01565 [Planctomycetes bacterium]|nr:hypothetical protein [Planctomycetota bacterium]